MNKPLTTANIPTLGYEHRRVLVYWNLTRKCWSLLDQRTRRLIGHHRGEVWLSSCAFPVSQAGRARVLRDKRKNVHAFVEGTVMVPHPLHGYANHILLGAHDSTVSYNPYKVSSFVDGDGRAVQRASVAKLGDDTDPASRKVLVWGAA